MQAIAFWQLLTVVAVPTLMVFVGILLNRQDFNRLDEKFESLTSQLHNGMMMIHSILRDHEGRISRLESR
jgi:hypothetical protein